MAQRQPLAVSNEPEPTGAEEATEEHEAGEAGLRGLLAKVDEPRAPKAAAVPALRTARIVAVEMHAVRVAWRGDHEAVLAKLAPGVDRELIAHAAEEHEAVLVEQEEGEIPVVVGVLQTRFPRELKLRATTISIEAEREILLRAGRSALRIREDGEVEVVGSRIVAASRGLLRLAGRILRLN